MTDSVNSSQKVTRDRLFKAYEGTCFIIDAPEREIQLRIGQRCPQADDLLRQYGVTGAAFITAWNPGSVRLTKAENDRRQKSMESKIESRGYRFLRGRGKGTDPSWEPEESVLIIGIPKESAVKLSQQFGQFAIVWHQAGEKSLLIST